MATSSIEWTEETWNPVTGCTILSRGCSRCYAMRMAARLEAMGQAKYAGTTKKVNGLAVWTGKINLVPDAMSIPLRKRKPTTYFVNSMSDLFHEAVPFDFIDKVFAVMALCPHHTFQVLTKRPERMAEYLGGSPDIGATRHLKVWNAAWNLPEWSADHSRGSIEAVIRHQGKDHVEPWPLPNVWLGTSCEDQRAADERIPHLLRCPAAVRFLSVEPLLGPVEFSDVTRRSDAVKVLGQRALCGIDLVIAGGESGLGARPCHPAWATSIRDQCVNAGVAFFWKQWGEWEPMMSLWSYLNGMRDFDDPKEIRSMVASTCVVTRDGRTFDGPKNGRLGEWEKLWGEADSRDEDPEDYVVMHRVGKKVAGRLLDGRTWDEMPAAAVRPEVEVTP